MNAPLSWGLHSFPEHPTQLATPGPRNGLPWSSRTPSGPGVSLDTLRARSWVVFCLYHHPVTSRGHAQVLGPHLHLLQALLLSSAPADPPVPPFTDLGQAPNLFSHVVFSCGLYLREWTLCLRHPGQSPGSSLCCSLCLRSPLLPLTPPET